MIKKKLQKSIIKVISLFITIILVAGMFLFYSTMENTFMNYARQTNSRLLDQKRASFELILGQITDKINKLGIYEGDLSNIAMTRKDSILQEIKLYQKLNSIVLENQYLYSAYLYLESEDIVFDSKTGCAYSSDSFHDLVVLNAMKEKYFTKVNPHIIKNINGGTDLIYSIVVTLPNKTKDGHSTVLAVNVDINKMYQDIMKENIAENDVNLYVYDEHNQIIISHNITDISTNFNEIEKLMVSENDNPFLGALFLNKTGVMEAYVYSKELDWNFYLQVPFEVDISNMLNIYVTLIFICIIILAFIFIIYIIMNHTTKPLDLFIKNYNENIIKDLLTSSIFTNDKNNIDMESIKQLFPYNNFLVLFVYIDEGLLKSLHNHIEKFSLNKSKKIYFKVVDMHSGVIAVIYNYTSDYQGLYTFIDELYKSLKSNYNRKIYIAASNPRKGFQELLGAAKECEEILEYKLSLRDCITTYDKFVLLKGEVGYPINYEKQLINNLLVANLDGCIFYLDKYMEYLFFNQYIISDIRVKNYMYQLQTKLLNHISSLPISIKTSNCLDLEQISDKDYVYKSIIDLMQTICTEMTKKNYKNENILVQSILDYIENHLSDDNFNLNTISYQFNMNRNYLAKLIKENTSYTFNGYINYKKIEISKELLKDESLTIEQIANQIGFAYSHYFIKIFKNVEGITPGAYRKMLFDNKNANLK